MMISERKVTQDEMNEDRAKLSTVPKNRMHAYVPGDLTPNANYGHPALKLYERNPNSGIWVFMYWAKYDEVDEDKDYVIE